MSWVYPPDDLWCEFLDHPDGYWTCWWYYPEARVQVNTGDYKVGALSIELRCSANPYADGEAELILHFYGGRELNLTHADKVEFWAEMTRLGGGGGFDPHLTVWLFDAGGNRASKTFVMDAGGQWQLFSAGVGPKHVEEWMVPLAFDWTKITEIRFTITQFKRPYPWVPVTEYFRLDGALFYFLLDVAFITVESNPFLGVPVRIDEAAYDKTPVTFAVEPPGVRTVTVDETYDSWTFDHWDDGTTTPGRVVDATEPGYYRVTAFYKAPPTPPPTPPTPGWTPGYFIRYAVSLIQSLLGRPR